MTIKQPTPYQVRQARFDAGFTQKAAAAVLGKSYRTWQDWELNNAKMSLSDWLLFSIRRTMTESEWVSLLKKSGVME